MATHDSSVIPVSDEPLPGELSSRRLRRSLILVLAVAAAISASIALLPGLAALRTSFAGAEPAWIALATLAELLSCLSYVLVFRAVFCRQITSRPFGPSLALA
jgi:hypothetical protein